MKVIYSFYNSTGLGDNIRGLITIKQIQKILGFELYIDLNGHPIEPYLQYKSVSFNCEHTFFLPAPDDLCHNDYLINQLRNKTSVRISTNLYPDITVELDKNIKEFMKNFLLIKPDFDIDFINRELPEVYDLFHYRLGDKYMCQDTDGRAQNILLDDVFQHFLIHNTHINNSVLISDSLEFKEKCKNHTKVYLNDPIHTRFDSNHKVNSAEMIETIRDFYLIKTAQNVYAFSAFPWKSNFVLWTSKIYDVPLERI